MKNKITAIIIVFLCVSNNPLFSQKNKSRATGYMAIDSYFDKAKEYEDIESYKNSPLSIIREDINHLENGLLINFGNSNLEIGKLSTIEILDFINEYAINRNIIKSDEYFNTQKLKTFPSDFIAIYETEDSIVRKQKIKNIINNANGLVNYKDKLIALAFIYRGLEISESGRYNNEIKPYLNSLWSKADTPEEKILAAQILSKLLLNQSHFYRAHNILLGAYIEAYRTKDTLQLSKISLDIGATYLAIQDHQMYLKASLDWLEFSFILAKRCDFETQLRVKSSLLVGFLMAKKNSPNFDTYYDAIGLYNVFSFLQNKKTLLLNNSQLSENECLVVLARYFAEKGNYENAVCISNSVFLNVCNKKEGFASIDQLLAFLTTYQTYIAATHNKKLINNIGLKVNSLHIELINLLGLNNLSGERGSAPYLLDRVLRYNKGEKAFAIEYLKKDIEFYYNNYPLAEARNIVVDYLPMLQSWYREQEMWKELTAINDSIALINADRASTDLQIYAEMQKQEVAVKKNLEILHYNEIHTRDSTLSLYLSNIFGLTWAAKNDKGIRDSIVFTNQIKEVNEKNKTELAKAELKRSHEVQRALQNNLEATEKYWSLLTIGIIMVAFLLVSLISSIFTNIKTKKEKDFIVSRALSRQTAAHFLLNKINKIALSLSNGNISQAQDQLYYYSKYLAELLTHEGEKVTLSKELETIVIYFDFLKKFDEKNLEKLVVNSNNFDLNSLYVPSHFLIEIIDNAIKNKRQNTPVKIAISVLKYADATYHILVEDNGIGLSEKPNSTSTKLGLKNFIVRLDLFNKENKGQHISLFEIENITDKNDEVCGCKCIVQIKQV